jgi:hypothetical protein
MLRREVRDAAGAVGEETCEPSRRVLQLAQAVRTDLTSDDPHELLAGTGADRRMVAVVGSLDEDSRRAGEPGIGSCG